MKKFVGALCGLASLVSFESSAFASGELINNARITKVVVRNSTGELMVVGFSGGSGPCTGAGQVTFPTTGDADRDNRMVSLATAGLLSGKSFRAYDYLSSSSSTDCTKAGYIALSD